jgi:hypothetical protein
MRDDTCGHAESTSAFALQALPPEEVASVKAHIVTCKSCRQLLDSLRPVLESFAAWPTDVLRPSTDLWDRLAERIGATPEQDAAIDALPQWREPGWGEVAPGISCKLLANDLDRDIASMLVRLAPGAEYPPHRHAGVEELHLLDGELWINERKLYPGDYNRAEPGTADARVWSETGCTCVLVTSALDELA